MFDSHIINALGWTLIHFLWQGSAIVLIYWLISRSSESLHAKYWTGMSAVMLCILIPTSQFISLIQQSEVTESFFVISSSYQSMALKPMSAIDTVLMLVNQTLPILVFSWALIVTLLTTGLIRSWFRLNAIEHDCDATLSAELKQFIKNTAIKLDLAAIPILKVSKKIFVPAAYGIYKPTVLLPLSLMSQIPKEQIHAIITHELCHLKRNDYLHNILQLTADILLFFHPAIRWMNNDIRQVREQCCDQLVLSQDTHAITYAKALTNIASLSNGHSFGPRLQIGINDGLLLKRVKFLLQNKSSQSSIMMFLPLGILLLACFYLFQSNQAPIGFSDTSTTKSSQKEPKINKRLVSNLFYPKQRQQSDFTLAAETVKPAESWRLNNTSVAETFTAESPKNAAITEDFQLQIVDVEIENALPTSDLRNDLLDAFESTQPAVRYPAVELTTINDLEIMNPVDSNTHKSNHNLKATSALIKPKLKSYLAPEYPNEFWKKQVEQTVIASFKIKPNGKLYDIEMNSQGNNYVAFEQNVKTILRKWRFEKDSLNRTNMQKTYQQIFEFKLSSVLEKNCQRATTGSRMKKAIACNQ
ncbi:M56 family metallopeptidase [Marinicella rhabdoformis]|uniref:M56 family metallopeptidase n=1 Tax=Marinicella rhabdoformis TaxID=2580566 RepID=UPI0012AEC731|nr:M56 family metallopeptidase [Marinicella rhabdoformis]